MYKQKEKIRQTKIVKKSEGITLIALVITIIVLLILVGVSIVALIGDDGIIKNAADAKKNTEIAREKEQIQLSVAQIMESEKNNIIDKSKLNEELSNYKATITSEDENSYYIKYNDSQRYYKLDKNGNVELLENVTEKKLTLQCVNSKNDILQEETYIIITDNYKEELPKINDYISFEDTISGNITEDTIVSHLYYKILDDDTELVFTGLNTDGQITTDDSEIVNYMIGNNNYRSGYKDIQLQSVLKIPEYYKNKKVTEIGDLAFYECRNLIKAYIGNNIEIIGDNAFHTCSSLKEIIMSDSVKTLETAAFCLCPSLERIKLSNNVSTLPYNLFHGDEKLSYLYIGEKTKTLERSVMFDCTSLTNIEINEKNEYLSVFNNIIYNKEQDKIICCPPAVAVGSITINDKAKSIEECAFLGCTLLTDLTVEGNVTDIGNDAFWGCTSLKTIKLGDNVTNLLGACFCWCDNLTDVEIGSGVKVLGTNLFCGDSKLSELKYNGTTQQWNDITKKTNWDQQTAITKIICNNGIINKE